MESFAHVSKESVRVKIIRRWGGLIILVTLQLAFYSWESFTLAEETMRLSNLKELYIKEIYLLKQKKLALVEELAVCQEPLRRQQILLEKLGYVPVGWQRVNFVEKEGSESKP